MSLHRAVNITEGLRWLPRLRGMRLFLLVAVIASLNPCVRAEPADPQASSPEVYGPAPGRGGGLQLTPFGPASLGGCIEEFYTAVRSVENWLVLGIVLLVGRFGGKLVRILKGPAVVGYLLVGVILGRSVFGLISAESARSLEVITDFGLGIVAFMIGTELSRALFRKLGRQLLVILIGESLSAFCLVALLLWALSSWVLPSAGSAVGAALIFGGLAAASAPAGTAAVIHEYKAKGPLTSMVLAIVGLDDAVAIIIYAFAAAVAKTLIRGGETTILSFLRGPCLEILGGMVIGGILGFLLGVMLRRLREPADVLTFTLGAILLATGIANALHLSLILTNLAVGTVLANTSIRETERAYTAIEQITQPVFILFFVVAGAHLDITLLGTLSVLGLVYILARSIGKMAGAYVGARITSAAPVIRRNVGLGILSQAGVAIGLALTAGRQFRSPGYGLFGQQLAEITINTIMATTIVFEVLGPIMAKIALVRAGEIPSAAVARGDVP